MPIRSAAGRGSLRAILRFLTLVLTACAPAAPALPVAEGFVAVSGGDSLFYRMVGTGPDTVLVLHGGPMLDSRYLETALRPLGAGHALLFYDQRGRGRSSESLTPDALTLASDVTDLEALRRHFGLERLTVVAHHWGAAILLKHALLFPGHLTRAVLLAPFPHSGGFYSELIRRPSDAPALAAHLRAREAGADTTDPVGYCRRYWGMAFSPVEETDPAVLRALAPAVCAEAAERLLAREGRQRRLAASLGTWDWSDSLALVGAPTLVVVGAGDPALIAGARAWAARLRDARVLVAGDSPLFPWVQDPEAVRAAMRSFLDGAWPAGAAPAALGPAAVIGS
ncbi:MAG: alpha/beta fold hydrolase [Gemmatimonadota bacterium]|nr:alpha/beta fold hydrolase [Gemmatimonadota bacterium]